MVMHFKQLNATQFAEAIGVQRSNVSHILSGRNKPSLDFIHKVSTAFPEIDLHWLIHNKGTYPQAPPSALPSSVKHSAPSKATAEEEDHLKSGTIVTSEKKTPEHHNSSGTSEKAHSEEINTSRALSRIILIYTDGTFEELKPTAPLPFT